MSMQKAAAFASVVAVNEAVVAATGMPSWFVQIAGFLLFTIIMWSIKRNLQTHDDHNARQDEHLKSLTEKQNTHGERIAALEARTAPRNQS